MKMYVEGFQFFLFYQGLIGVNEALQTAREGREFISFPETK